MNRRRTLQGVFYEARLDCRAGQAAFAGRNARGVDVSISGYQAWKLGGAPNRKRLTDSQVLVLIRTIHAELKGAYGTPRMVRELRARGFSASKQPV